MKKVVKEFIKSDSNLRNSEGSFCRLKDGRIAFAFSKYRNGCSDDSTSDIAVCFSSDEGKTFTEPTVIFRCEDFGGTNLMSVSLLENDDGEICVFYLKKIGKSSCRMFMQKTFDFKSFTDEVQCIKNEGYFVVNNDRVVRLSSGRVVIPSAYVPIDKDGNYGMQTAQFYVSDDGCKTFRLLSSVNMPYKIFNTGMQEPGILEFEKGKVVMFSRNNSGRQFVAFSDDFCESWTCAEPSRFESPCAPMSSKKLSDGRILFIYNPIPEYYGRKVFFGGVWMGGRTPLVLSVCKDNINNEIKLITLEDDEESGFCYTAIYELEDKILLAYCCGNCDDGLLLNRMRIVTLDKNDLI